MALHLFVVVEERTERVGLCQLLCSSKTCGIDQAHHVAIDIAVFVEGYVRIARACAVCFIVATQLHGLPGTDAADGDSSITGSCPCATSVGTILDGERQRVVDGHSSSFLNSLKGQRSLDCNEISTFLTGILYRPASRDAIDCLACFSLDAPIGFISFDKRSCGRNICQPAIGSCILSVTGIDNVNGQTLHVVQGGATVEHTAIDLP